MKRVGHAEVGSARKASKAIYVREVAYVEVVGRTRTRLTKG